MNISIVDVDCIEDLKDLRDSLEIISRKRLSMADVIKALIHCNRDTTQISKYV